MNYGYTREVDHPFDRAVERVTEELGKEGFGVLTSIDVKDTLKKKLDEDRRPYVILGACNPHFAHQALQMEEDLGLLLPCNAVVYENEKGHTVIGAIDTHAMLGLVGNDALDPVADEVNARLRRAIDAV
ncbi:MAG TPA: DUF302 domain-containing protein [Candidatus Krumholzibacteria bacterium]|nr:DUF302 domain-containing protein [Candidatus Krumholzibacteria bacterium]